MPNFHEKASRLIGGNVTKPFNNKLVIFFLGKISYFLGHHIKCLDDM